MDRPPPLSEAVMKVAMPPSSGCVPSVVLPSRKMTMPVGIAVEPDGALTVAVNVTSAPNTDGLKDEAREIVTALPVVRVRLVEPNDGPKTRLLLIWRPT